ALDYDKVLETAVKITEKDNNNIRFSVDANLVRRLGEQLVAKKTTAVSELVKNAYDADSTLVNVYFELNEANPRIVIFDDGTGMSKEDIINGFMRISTSEKEDNSVSERYQRLRAGRKGIG
ncbi:ATP-binding protein, partial [Escherichia coli]